MDNKLALQLGKTESIILGSTIKLCNLPELNVQCNGTNFRPKPTVKYLAAEIDHYVSGENMAGKIIEKVSSRRNFWTENLNT